MWKFLSKKSISFELLLPSALRSWIFFVEKDIRYLRSTRKLCYRVLEKKTRLSQSFVQVNPTTWCLQSPPRTIKLLRRPLERPQFPSSEAIPVEASLLKRSAIKTIKPWQPGRGGCVLRQRFTASLSRRYEVDTRGWTKWAERGAAINRADLWIPWEP